MTTLITGASSGIGEAIALECAKRGDILFLCGQNLDRLNNVLSKCIELGADKAYAKCLDVRDEEAVREWIYECENIAPLERVFANAGVGTGIEDEGNVRKTFAVNVNGTVNTVLPAITSFRKRKASEKTTPLHIIITASIAGYGPLSSCPAYSATKSCLKTWALSLRGMLKDENIRVSAVCPGFVRSRITDRNKCPMPFFMEADRAAKIILSRADKNVGLIAFPWPMRFATWFLSTLPYRFNELLNKLLPKKY